ncbi:MAG: SGNH/GDSL hydrolase family protein [Pirellulales bacterium]
MKITEDPNLPRVLLIGDSISMGYTLPVRELLKGKANVLRVPMNGGPTTRGLESMKDWLGDGRWDVIHFNWGLHDLKFMPEGHRQVELEAYTKNLRELVKQMKAGARREADLVQHHAGTGRRHESAAEECGRFGLQRRGGESDGRRRSGNRRSLCVRSAEAGRDSTAGERPFPR